jgi:cytochrome c553
MSRTRARRRALLGRLLLAGLLAAVVGTVGSATLADADPDPELTAILALDGDAERGASAYRTCAVCHGPEGAGRADGTFPRIAGQHPEVMTKQLVDIRSGRRRNPVMKPHADALIDRQQVANVVAYVATLRVVEPPGRGPGNDLARGEQLYRRDCARCHGPAGEGDGPAFVPLLAGQHYAYLTRQIRAIAGGRRGNAHSEMLRQVRAYSDPQLQAVVDYAGRLDGRTALDTRPLGPHAPGRD